MLLNTARARARGRGGFARRRKDNGRAKCTHIGRDEERARECDRWRENERKERKGQGQGKREVIVEGGMKGARKDKGKKWRRLWRGSARERKGKRDVWTSLRRDGWVSLEQTRVRGIIKRFIRLLSRSYSALFIRPVSPRFFFLATTAPLFSLPFYKSPRAEQFDKGCGVGDETEIKKRREGGYCGARGPWLKYTSEPRGFLLISPDPYVSSPSPTIPFLSSLYYAVSFFLSPFPFFFFFFLPFLLSIFYILLLPLVWPRKTFLSFLPSNATVRVFGEFGMSCHREFTRTELDRAYILRSDPGSRRATNIRIGEGLRGFMSRRWPVLNPIQS